MTVEELLKRLKVNILRHNIQLIELFFALRSREFFDLMSLFYF